MFKRRGLQRETSESGVGGVENIPDGKASRGGVHALTGSVGTWKDDKSREQED